MASTTTTTTSTPLPLSAITAPGNKAPPPRLPAQCMTPPSPPLQSSTHLSMNTAYCRTNVVARATGEAPAEVVVVARDTPEAPAEVVATPTETPEIVKTIQEAWEKVEDKYAVTSLAVAGGVALWASAGVVSAIDRLPLVPGVLELVGIGYTGWFAYKNLASKPEREALIKKIKDTYNDIIGSS